MSDNSRLRVLPLVATAGQWAVSAVLVWIAVLNALVQAERLFGRLPDGLSAVTGVSLSSVAIGAAVVGSGYYLWATVGSDVADPPEVRLGRYVWWIVVWGVLMVPLAYVETRLPLTALPAVVRGFVGITTMFAGAVVFSAYMTYYRA